MRYVRQGLYGGKVGSILCSNWPPVQTRWSDLAFSGLLTLFDQYPATLTPQLINRINIKETILMCLLNLIKPQVAVHESTAPIQENPHGGNQEN